MMAPVAAQDDEPPVIGLAGSTQTTVTVDPTTSSLAVVQRYRFANTTEAEAFTGFFETLPVDAVDVTATIAGLPVDAVNLPSGEGFAEWLISFPEPFLPGDPAFDVTLSWRRTGLTGDPDDFDLVSDGVIAIAPYVAGHQEDEAQLTVIVPGEYDIVVADGYEIDTTADGITFDVRVPTSGQYVPLPIVLEAPDRYSRQSLEGPIDITLATPGGPSTWLAEDLSPLVDELGAWIPLELPEALEFRQGYTGGDDLRRVDDGVFVLPFEASPSVALRAVAVAWLEPLPFDDTGLRDDLAAALADRVASSAGVTVPPRSTTWSTAVTALTAVSNADIASTVLTALEGGIPAYGGTADTFVADVIDWRRFTDVYEHLGGIESAGDAMRLSTTTEQTAELDLRAVALGDYRALEERAAPWAMPPLLRDAMAEWRFADFANQQGPVSDLVGARDEMIAAAGAVELEIGDEVQQRFEAAETSMDDAWTLYVEQREALDHVAEALRLDTGDRGLLSSLGMAGRDTDAQLARMQALWDAGEFNESAEAAEHLIEDYESSVGRGTLRLLGPLTILVIVIAALRRLRQRGLRPGRQRGAAA